MSPNPEQPQLLSLHQRILEADPTAFAELCELALPAIVEHLQTRFPKQGRHAVETVAIDLLLNYHKRPKQYDPDKLDLLAYFGMAAERDMLNTIRRVSRRESHLRELDDHSEALYAAAQDPTDFDIEAMPWLRDYTDRSADEIIEMLLDRLSPDEIQVLLLMLQDKRDYKEYVSALNIEDKDDDDQQRAVKRAKDRITKKMKRLGRRLSKP